MKKFNIVRVSMLVVLAFFCFTSYAQIPAGYYDPANGLTGDQLKAALHNIIDGHTTYPYSSSSTDTWDILKIADQDPNNPNNVIGIYSGFSMNGPNEYDGGNGWSREHVWAKSRGDFGTTEGAGTDLHHLRAEDVSTNSARSNRNFDYADYYYVDGSGSYSGATLSKTSDINYVWEPRDEVKGDVARMIFYMVVRYEGTNGDPDLELTDTYQSNTSKEPLHAKLTTLIEWHLNDPVTDAERARNEVIYGYQQNRNPFIDHPEWVCELYPTYCTPGGNIAPSFTSSAVTTATEGQAYSYNITTSDADGDPVTISATTLPTWLSLTDNGNGTGTLSGTPGAGDTGLNSVVLTVSDGTASTNQSFDINVATAGGGGGGTGPASDLFISEYIEGSSYNKGLEIANFTGSPVDLSQYALYKDTNGAGIWGSELLLSGTLADGEVYVIVHSSAAAAMQAVADLSTGSGPMSFNGNDAVALFKNGSPIDVVGNFNGAAYFAQDVTLVRKSSISAPNTTYTTSEWDQYPTDSFGDLGIHTFDGGSTTPTCDTPTTLSATNITTTSADISWSVSSNASSYLVEYRVSGSGTWSNTSTATTTVSLSGLTESTTYEYRVTADCGTSISTASSVATFTTATTPTCDTPTTLSATNITTTSADVSWSVSSNASSYLVEYRVSGTSIWSSTSSTVTSASLTGLSESTSYEYRVTADCGSLTSTPSTIATFTTNTAATCDAPGGLTAANISSTSADLSWNSTGAASYGVRYKESSAANWVYDNAATNSYVLNGLLGATTYEYQVRSQCGSLNSTYSASYTFTTLAGTVSYCSSSSLYANEEWIDRFTFNTIDNLSGTSNGYEDFTAISTSLTAGSTYNYSITPQWSGRSFNEAYDIWIDFNHNGDFNDIGEHVVTVSKSRDSFISGSITIPASASNGDTRMRVTMSYNSNATSCESFTYGEVEDYTVSITGGTGTGRIAGTSSPINDELQFDNGLVYPNPVQNRLTVTMPVRNKAEVAIQTTTGQVVASKVFLNNEEMIMDVSSLKNGLYILTIKEEGNLHTTKFIVE